MDVENQQPTMTNPMQIISHNFGWLNLNAIIGWIAGTFIGETVAMQIQPGGAAWWQHSAVISALVVAVFMLLGKLLDQHFKNKEKKIARAEELHKKEIEFWKTQLNMKQVSEFEARSRAHRFANETNRLSLHIFLLHSTMSKHSLEIPEFVPKHYEDLMLGLDEEVAKYRLSLAERLDDAIHKSAA